MPFPPIIPRRRDWPTKAEWVTTVKLMRDLPDLLAWHLEALFVMAKDRELSPPVRDAWWEVPRA